MNQRDQIRQFISGLLRSKGDHSPFADSESLILGGRLQSVDAVEIVMFLEKHFGVDFSIIGFDQTLIDSVDLMAALAIGRAAAAGSD